MVRTVGGMGLVVCLMIGIYFAVKKIAPKYFPGAVSAKNMKIVETLSMGDRRSISVIEVANNRFLIGNTAHQINLLTALPETISLVPHPDESSSHSNEKTGSRSIGSFRNLFEVEKKRSPHHEGNPLPENIRTKMRQLRDALER
jgi:flagellar biosynthetic protein FliO